VAHVQWRAEGEDGAEAAHAVFLVAIGTLCHAEVLDIHAASR
jgi:hypothetical protein